MIKMALCLALFSFLPAQGEDLTELKVSEAKITPAKPPEPQDRSEGSKAAAAAAAAGAASGKVNCYMLMDRARKTEDESQKTFLMMAASQQCSQAAALEQNAKENDKGRKQLSQNDIPTPAKYEAGTTTLQASSIKDVTLAANETSARRSILSSDSEGEPLNNTAPPTSPDAEAQKNELQSTNGINAQSLPAPGALSPIERPKLTVNDQATGAPAGAAGFLGGFPGSAEARTPNEGTNSNKMALKGEEKNRRSNAELSYLSASGGDSAAGVGEDPIDALMSQLMGDPGQPEQNENESTHTWESEPGQLSGTGESVNIFEYAALRYQKLQTEQKRLGLSGVAPAGRSVASATSLHEAVKRP